MKTTYIETTKSTRKNNSAKHAACLQLVATVTTGFATRRIRYRLVRNNFAKDYFL